MRRVPRQGVSYKKHRRWRAYLTLEMFSTNYQKRSCGFLSSPEPVTELRILCQAIIGTESPRLSGDDLSPIPGEDLGFLAVAILCLDNHHLFRRFIALLPNPTPAEIFILMGIVLVDNYLDLGKKSKRASHSSFTVLICYRDRITSFTHLHHPSPSKGT